MKVKVVKHKKITCSDEKTGERIKKSNYNNIRNYIKKCAEEFSDKSIDKMLQDKINHLIQ